MKQATRISLMAMVAMMLFIAPGLAARVGTANFSGIVDHISANNLKVTDPRTHQSLSFLILPKFDQVFSADGKTTYQMRMIKPGQYVKVYYDQKALGARHADRILILTQGNMVRAKDKE